MVVVDRGGCSSSFTWQRNIYFQNVSCYNPKATESKSDAISVTKTYSQVCVPHPIQTNLLFTILSHFSLFILKHNTIVGYLYSIKLCYYEWFTKELNSQ